MSKYMQTPQFPLLKYMNPSNCEENYKQSESSYTIPKHLFNAKFKAIRERFSELDLFRKQITESKAGHHHQPYSLSKKHVLCYKLIFFGLSLLFLILAWTSVSLPAGFGCSFIFSSCALLKSGVFSVCMFLSFCSFIMGLAIKVEREVVIQTVRNSKLVLKTIYKRKMSRMGSWKLFVFFGQGREEALQLKHAYDEVYDKMNEQKEAAILLLWKISNATSLEKEEKEALFNQAIEELNERLISLTHTFRHA